MSDINNKEKSLSRGLKSILRHRQTLAIDESIFLPFCTCEIFTFSFKNYVDLSKINDRLSL